MPTAPAPPGSASPTRRVLTGSVLTILGFGGSQALRLGGNLILTRLLMPEAFGLMTLITILLVGLKLFSDMGIGQSILRSPRGDQRDFLDTAWSLDLIRGFALWATACLLAWPLARFYAVDGLAAMIVVAASSLAVAGFEPTRVDSAIRHMQLGRITIYDLNSQFLALLATILLTWITRSVWALVWGQVIASAIRLLLMTLALPGPRNRLWFDRSSVVEILSFGKWVFVSTIAGFVVMQGDRIILSTFIDLPMLGIYGIGQALAALPVMIGAALVGRLMIPIYRSLDTAGGTTASLPIRRYRFGLSAGLLALAAIMVFAAVPMIRVLYDPRYQQAAAIIIGLSIAFMPQLITISYDQIALAAGDSRSFFMLTAMRGGLLLLCLSVGAAMFGLKGVIIGYGAASLLAYPLIARLAHRYHVWDPAHDAIMGLVAIIISVLGAGLNWSFLSVVS